MNKEYKVFSIISNLVLASIIFSVNRHRPIKNDVFVPVSINTQVETCEKSDIPSVGIDESYKKYSSALKTYADDLGFSFQYPPYMKILAGGKIENWIILESPDDTKDKTRNIVVSIGLNDENMTPEEWLMSIDSGYIQSQKLYGKCYKTTIDGQNAVYTDGGMWIVVNTPNNKYRLSIADLTTGGADRPFTETGIIVESLRFDHQ